MNNGLTRSISFKLISFITLCICAWAVNYYVTQHSHWMEKSREDRFRSYETNNTSVDRDHKPTQALSNDFFRKEIAVSSVLKSFRSSPKVSIGYFEGFRSYWLFERFFQKFDSQVNCTCPESKMGLVSKEMFSKLSEIGKYDIVVFPYDVTIYSGNEARWKTIHKQYKKRQRWVYATRETPYKVKKSFLPETYTANTFHWSCTYRSKADIPSPYGFFRPFPAPRPEMKKNWAKNKTRLIAWMSTNSAIQWNRKQLVEEMSSQIDIDIYGGPEGMPCPRNSSECDEKIKSHKFYLAFENSCCREYISEKFWRTLTMDVVPVVIGAPKEDFLNIAPPNSFIYADDFETMSDLISYLQYLDKNDKSYEDFFAWKVLGEVVNLFPDSAKKKVNGGKPPTGLFYSCEVACKMALKYLRERRERNQKKTFFDPRSQEWGGSCVSCADHDWISRLQIKNDLV
ncbi:Glycoprotein 3-alpha-L-fucosyltransferase A [Holothuria leucospilota]|uniref:Fucosyltransferase n=1 Tax=Holothuria leucospilota TaxID=206669 RepID=A0A9Q0YJJ2_HOLLE|nr:Glycoprotein 3-alpha-L-fucosyltransferase A [Holothuria leucospilota]